jgi:pimeloyl-ACP methyl ester carboxylesterase
MDRDLTRRAWSTPPIPEVALEPPAVGRLAEVTVPTLVVNGLSDVPQITDLGRIIAGTIPHAAHVLLPNTGHLPALERPDAVNSAILDFL